MQPSKLAAAIVESIVLFIIIDLPIDVNYVAENRTLPEVMSPPFTGLAPCAVLVGTNDQVTAELNNMYYTSVREIP